MKTGHFTQVVWKGTKELGIGRASKKNSKGMYCTYVVGRYKAPGNFKGKFQKEVAKGKFDKSVCKKLDEMIAKISGTVLCCSFSLGLLLYKL